MFQGSFGFCIQWLSKPRIASFATLISFTSYVENDDIEEPFRFSSDHNHTNNINNYNRNNVFNHSNYNYCNRKIKTVMPPPFMRPDEEARKKLVLGSFDTLLLKMNIESSDDESENNSNDNFISVTPQLQLHMSLNLLRQLFTL